MTDNVLQQAEQFKTNGNDFLKQRKHAEAAAQYTQGIDLITKLDSNGAGEEQAVKESLSTLYSNRCAAYLSQQKFDLALDDARKALEIRPDWNRAMLRVGQALVGLLRYEDAIEHLKKSLEKKAGDQQLQQLLSDAEQRLQQQIQQEQATGIGSLFQGQKVWQKIETTPNLAPFLQQPDFVQKIKQIQENPSTINMHLQDPRVMQVMAAMLGIDAAMAEQEEERRAREEEEARERRRQEEEKKKREEEERKKREEEERQAAMSEEEKQANDLKDQGNELYKKRRFAEALELYEKAIQLCPDNIVFRLNRAAVLLEMGEIDKCIEGCHEAINIGSSDFQSMAKAYARLGNAYMRKKDYDNAIKYYKDALVEHRTRDVALRLQEAEKQKRIAEELAYQDPEISRQEREKGNQMFKEGKFPEAVQCYKEAIKRNPNDPAGYSNLAAAYMKLAEYPYAVKNCDEALKRDPTFVKAYIRKAQSQMVMKEYHKAMDTFQEGLKLDPENAELKEGYQKLMIAIQMGDKDEERIKRAQQDPEIQQILSDPFMGQVLRDLSENPASARDHMQNPDIANKINKLIAAGIIQTR